MINYDVFRKEYLKLRPDAGEDEVLRAYGPNSMGLGEAFPRGVKSGFYQTLGGFGTIGEMAGLPTGEWAERQYKSAEDYALPEELQGYVWDKPELATDPRWLLHTTGQALPSILSSFLPGAAVAKGASMIPKLAPYATALGAGVGGLSGGALEGAGTYRETGDLGQAATFGAASALLNSIPMAQMLGGGSLPSRMLKGAVGEAVTEWAEEPTEAVITGKDPIEAMKQGLNVVPPAFLSALLLGAPMAVTQRKGGKADTDTKPSVETAETLDAALKVYSVEQADTYAQEVAKFSNFDEDVQTAIAEMMKRPTTVGINTPERQQLRGQIGEQLYGQGAQLKERHIDIMIGPPAAGKSTIAEEVAKQHGAMIIDSDMAKELLPEYDGGMGANAVHEESKLIIDGVLRRALANGDNIVLPIIGKNHDKVLKQISAFRQLGYNTSVQYVDLPIEKATERAIARFRKTGRFVSPEYIASVGTKPKETYEALKNERAAEEFKAYSTDVEFGQPAKLLEEIHPEDGEGRLGRRPVAGDLGGTGSGAQGETVIAEAIPSTSTGLGQRLVDADYEVRDRYTKAAYEAIHDESGQDLLMQAITGTPVTSQRIGQGTFEGAISPNIQTETGRSDEVADLYALGSMYAFEQDGVPWLMFDPEAQDGAQGVRVRFKNPDRQTIERFYKHLQSYIKGGEFTVMGNDAVAINFSELSDQEFNDAVLRAVQDFDAPIDGVDAGIKTRGNYHDITQYNQGRKWENPEEAQRALEAEFRRRGRPDLLPALHDLRQRIGQVNAAFEKELTEGVRSYAVSSAEADAAAADLDEILSGMTVIKGENISNLKIDYQTVTDEDVSTLEAKFGVAAYENVNGKPQYRPFDESEKRAVTAILKAASGGAPIRLAMENIDHIGAIAEGAFPESVMAQYVPAQRGHLGGLYFNPKIIAGAMSGALSKDAQAGIITTLYHEMGHAIDTNTSGTLDSHAFQSPSFYVEPVAMRLVDDSDTELGGRLVYDKERTGPIMAEVIDAFQEDHSDLQRFFIYPLIDLPHIAVEGRRIGPVEIGPDMLRSDVGQMMYRMVAMELSPEIERIQGEVFAQLHALYYTNPELMQNKLPKSYQLMEKIHEIETTVTGADATNHAIREALRAAGPERGTKGFERANWSAFGTSPQQGIRGWAADSPVGPAGPESENPQLQAPVQGPVQGVGAQPQQAPPFVEAARQGMSAERLADISKRGSIPQATTQHLAHLLGTSPGEIEKFLRRTIGTNFNAEQVAQAALILEREWNTSQKQAADMVAKLDKGEMTDKDWVRFEELLYNLNALQAQFMGVRGEMGRGLAIYNKVKDTTKVAEAVQMIVDQHGGRDVMEEKLRMLASLEQPEAGLQAAREAIGVTRGDQLVEWYINSLVSGIPTHVVNVTSNLLVSILEDINRFVAAGIGMFHGGEKVSLEEAIEHAAASIPGAMAGFKAFGEAVKDENSPLQFRGKMDQPYRRAIPGKFGKVVRVPTRMLGAEDAFSKTMAMTKELHALAVRESRRTGTPVQELIDNPPKEMVEEAWKAGYERTFTSRPGPLAQALLQLRRRNKLWNLIFPFVTTPANIVKHAMKFSLAAPLFQEVRKELKAGGARRDIALARIATGSSVAAAVMGFAAAGLITGAAPDDPNKRRLWHASGKQPYSIKIGDTWYSYSRLEPVGMLFGISADAWDLAQRIGVDEADKIATLVIASISHNLLSKTYLRGMADTVNAMTDPERYGERWVKSLVTGALTPVFLSYTAKAADPQLREAETILEALKARIPGMSQQLEPRLDVFGRPVTSEGSAGYRFFSPAYQKKDVKDPVANELLRLDVSVPSVGKKMMGVDLTTTQRNQLKKILGASVYGGVQRVINAPGYKRLPDPAKAYVLDRVVSGIRRYGRLYWQMQHPEVMRLAKQIKAQEYLERGG